MHHPRARTLRALWLAWKGSPGFRQDHPFHSLARSGNPRGFSLIEYLFAIFLVLIAALLMAATLPLANAVRARADRHNRALNIAQKQLEAIKAQGYANVSGTRLFEVGLLDSPTPDGSGRFSFTNTDTAFFDAPSQVLPDGRGYVVLTSLRLDLVQITVLVEW
ncbi:MAG: hypothetical protein K6T17_09155, partial [Fimbriimonadales bacterium]|nr:hypothetical protein [Fimbriimonadales bacterium]